MDRGRVAKPINNIDPDAIAAANANGRAEIRAIEAGRLGLLVGSSSVRPF
jgi:hypothetical protein